MHHPLTEVAVQHLRRLVAFPTVSGTPNLDALSYVAAHLEAAGAQVEVLPDGDTGRGNLIAHFGNERLGGLMLSGHIDVVPAEPEGWDGDPFQARVTADRVTARGSADMKGFLACLIAFFEHVRVPDDWPVTIAVTDDEERTFSGARNMVTQLESRSISPRLNIVGEPTLCQVAVSHPGFSDWTTTFGGVSGHSGRVDPAGGAIDAAVVFISNLRDAARLAGDQAPRINFGRIGGGSARNVVAAAVTLEWEARVAGPAQSAWLSSWLQANSGLVEANHCVAQAESFVAGVDDDLLEACQRATRREPIRVSYASEAGLYQAAGIPTVVLGPGDIAVAHRPGEYLELGQISRMLEILAELRSPNVQGWSMGSQ